MSGSRTALYPRGISERGMDFSSEVLAQAIKTRSPSISQQELQHRLAFWSIPDFGTQYAFKTQDPFWVILRSNLREGGKESDHLHFKVIDQSKTESIIEIWDYRIFH